VEERFSTLVFSGFPGSRPPCRAGTLAKRRRMRERVCSLRLLGLLSRVVNSVLCARGEAGEERRVLVKRLLGTKKVKCG